MFNLEMLFILLAIEPINKSRDPFSIFTDSNITEPF